MRNKKCILVKHKSTWNLSQTDPPKDEAVSMYNLCIFMWGSGKFDFPLWEKNAQMNKLR